MQTKRRHVCRETFKHGAKPLRQRYFISTPSLRHNRKYPRGKSRAAFRPWKTDDHDRPKFGNLIQIREQFDLIMIRAQNVSFERVIVFCRSDSRIGIGGFVARRGDFAFFAASGQRLDQSVCIATIAPAGIWP